MCKALCIAEFAMPIITTSINLEGIWSWLLIGRGLFNLKTSTTPQIGQRGRGPLTNAQKLPAICYFRSASSRLLDFATVFELREPWHH